MMTGNKNNIDNYFKEHLSELESDTSKNLWGKIYWMLIYKKVLLAILILGLAVVIPIIIFPTSDHTTPATSDTPNNYSAENANINATERPTSNHIENQAKPSPNKTNNQTQTITTKERKTETKNQPDESAIFKMAQNDIKSTDQSRSYKQHKEINYTVAPITKYDPLTFINFKQSIFHVINSNQSFQKRNNTESIYTMSNNGGDTLPDINAKWSVGLLLNPGYSMTELSAIPEYDDYISKRKNSEEGIFTLGISAEIRASINNFYIQSGIDYSIFGQNGNYSNATNQIDNEQSYFNYDTTWAWVYDPPYAYPYPISIDSMYVPVYEIETHSARNRYSYIEIPIIFGAQFNTDKKVGFDIGAGFSFGYLISAKGNLPLQDQEKLSEISASSDFLRNTSINLIIQSGIKFQLGKKTTFIARPFYQGNLQSNFKKDFPVSQKFSKLGISFGFNVKL